MGVALKPPCLLSTLPDCSLCVYVGAAWWAKDNANYKLLRRNRQGGSRQGQDYKKLGRPYVCVCVCVHMCVQLCNFVHVGFLGSDTGPRACQASSALASRLPAELLLTRVL